MSPSGKKVVVIGVVIFGLLFVVGVILSLHQKKQTVITVNRSPLAGMQPEQTALTVVINYLAAREDSVGTDQSSPESWITNVKAISTSAWYSQLQSSLDVNSPTSSVSADYYTAHTSNYGVITTVSNCMWKDTELQPTTTNGTVFCSLTDTTINATSKAVIDPSNLPSGWTHSGKQIPPTLDLVKQNGNWLVNDDTTGQGS